MRVRQTSVIKLCKRITDYCSRCKALAMACFKNCKKRKDSVTRAQWAARGDGGMTWVWRDGQHSCRHGKPLTAFCSWWFGLFFTRGKWHYRICFHKEHSGCYVENKWERSKTGAGRWVRHAMSISLFSWTLSCLCFKLPPRWSRIGHSMPTCRLSCFFLCVFYIYYYCIVCSLYCSDLVLCLFPPQTGNGLKVGNYVF